MAALMAAASIWVSILLTMSIFATILPHMRYTSMLVVEPMFQKAAAIIAAIKQNLKPYFVVSSCYKTLILQRHFLCGIPNVKWP